MFNIDRTKELYLRKAIDELKVDVRPDDTLEDQQFIEQLNAQLKTFKSYSTNLTHQQINNLFKDLSRLNLEQLFHLMMIDKYENTLDLFAANIDLINRLYYEIMKDNFKNNPKLTPAINQIKNQIKYYIENDLQVNFNLELYIDFADKKIYIEKDYPEFDSTKDSFSHMIIFDNVLYFITHEGEIKTLKPKKDIY